MTDDPRKAAPPSVESSSSVGKALHILSLFGPERPEWGASEIARELSVTVPTAHRLLNVLTHPPGFLARSVAGVFALDSEAISLGRRALASIDPVPFCAPTSGSSPPRPARPPC